MKEQKSDFGFKFPFEFKYKMAQLARRLVDSGKTKKYREV